MLKVKHPDLYFNRATLLIQTLDLPEAISDLKAAVAIEPSENSSELLSRTESAYKWVQNTIRQKAGLKPKALELLRASIPNRVKDLPADQCPLLPQLKEGENQNKYFIGKAVAVHKDPKSNIRMFAVFDSEMNCTVVSMYNVDSRIEEKVKLKESLIVVKNPYLKTINSEDDKTEDEKLKIVKAMRPDGIIVDGINLQNLLVEQDFKPKLHETS